MQDTYTSPRALRHLDKLSRLMDAQFQVPGTKFRFGLDAIIGLIPGAGDLSTFAVSGYMLVIMAQNGASSYVLTRMVLNILIDALFGSIPILGDLFDMAFKANMRNMKLMQQYYKEGRHGGSGWRVIIPVLIIVLLIIITILWLMYRLIASLINSF